MYVRRCYTSICSLCVCHGTPRRGQQRFRLSTAVSGHHSALQCGRTRGSLVETEGAREGAEWSRVKAERRKRGSGCVSRAVLLNIRLESITHTAMHFPLSHAITPPHRPRHGTLLCHFLPSVIPLPSTHLTPSHPVSLTYPLCPSLYLSSHALT